MSWGEGGQPAPGLHGPQSQSAAVKALQLSHTKCPINGCQVDESLAKTSWFSNSKWPFHKKFRRRQRQPTPVSLPGKSQGRRSLVGCRLWGRTVGLFFFFNISLRDKKSEIIKMLTPDLHLSTQVFNSAVTLWEKHSFRERV